MIAVLTILVCTAKWCMTPDATAFATMDQCGAILVSQYYLYQSVGYKMIYGRCVSYNL